MIASPARATGITACALFIALAGCGRGAPSEPTPELTRVTSAVITPFSTSLVASSPTFNRPYLGAAPPNDIYLGNVTTFVASSTAFKYSVQPISVTTTGSYDIEVVSGDFDDTVLYIYSGSFNPASPLTNLVVANDDQDLTYLSKIAGWTFTAGVNYFLVVTSYDPSSTGAVNFQGSGPSSLTVAAAASLGVTGFSSPIAGCTAGSITITAKDSGGSTSAAYRGTVHVTSSDPLAVLPADYTFVSGDSGVHTLAVTLKTAGTQSITVSDGASGISGSQGSITVQSASGRTIALQSGGTQSAAAGTSFAALQVKVTDGCAAANVVSGVSVTYAAPGSGASATLGSTSATTNASGLASITATANGVLGSYSVSATAPGGSSVNFSLTNTVGAARTVTVVSGSGQMAAPGAAFGSPLVAQVADNYGNPVPGAAITFTATGSGASATITGSPATANSSGQASVTATANATSGAYSVIASVTSGTTSATFSLTNQMPSVTLLPASIMLAPRASTTFMAGGGTAPYTFTLTGNQSGGMINGATGAYVAGTAGGTTDTVTVTDSSSITGMATIMVGPGVSVTPTATTVAPRGAQTFVASGGSGTGYTFALSTNNSGGTINGSTGAYTAGTTASVSDVVTATDSLGNTALVTIMVGAGITASPATTTVAPRGTRMFSATGGAGTGYTFALSTNHSGGSMTTGGAYTAGTTGSVSDVVTVSDALGNSGAATITVSAGVSITGGAGSAVPRGVLDFGASGGSGTGFTFSVTTNGSGGTISSVGHYMAGASGGTTDVIKVIDSLGNFTTTSVSVGAGVSLSPTAPHVAPLGGVTLTASGGSGTGFHYAITTNLSGGTVGNTTGAYTAGSAANAVDVVTATDSLGNTATVNVSVGAALSLSPGTRTLAPRDSITFVASGGSGSGYTFSLTTNGSGATIDGSTGHYAAGTTGTASDVVRVADPLGNSATATITVSAGVSLSPATATVAPLAHVALTVAGGSGSGYTFALSTNGSSGIVDSTTGRYVAGAVGGSTDVVTATDTLGNFALTTITVTAALAPTTATLSVAPGEARTLAVSGGAGAPAFSLSSNGSGGTVDATTGAYVAGHNADSTDVVTITDLNGAMVTVTITVGHGITISPSSPSAAPRAALAFTASGGSGAGYLYALSTNASGGSIDASAGGYTAGATSSVLDVLTVTDSFGNTASVSIAVGDALSLNPVTVTLSPRDVLLFAAAGGSRTGYHYTLATNGSGGHIDLQTGAYMVGNGANTSDVVQVQDSVGNLATATVTVGPGLIVTPNVLSLPPRGTTTLNAQGGSGSGYVFSFRLNASGGTIQNTTGLYRAGPTASTTDVVSVVDSLGNATSATISVGAGLTVLPTATTVSPRARLTFAAMGGAGQFQFDLRQNGSGGTIDASSGAYVAGDTPNAVDTIVATDQLGNSASVDITIGDALRLLTSTQSVAPGGQVTLMPLGGSGTGFKYQITTNNSGSHLDKSESYIAGNTADVEDVVTVTDSLGNSASAGIVVGDAVGITPPRATSSPRGKVTFTAFGGTASFTFSLMSNASGATIDAVTGLYTAGGTADVDDVVRVVDTLGKAAMATVHVGDGVSITPSTQAITPNGTIAFSVSGGAGHGYLFTLDTNASGATIDAARGLYAAGTVGGVGDVIRVTDALGNSDTAIVTVGSAVTGMITVATVTPGGSSTVLVTGGAGSYTFAFANNRSMGTINAVTGAYTAGMVGDVDDVIIVTDGNGAQFTVTIHVAAALTITPATTVTVAAGQSRTFAAAGGSGAGYTFKLLSSGSGGTVVATTGVYTAGKIAPSTDVLQLTDSLGNFAQVSIQVGGKGTTTGSGGCSCTTAGPASGAPFATLGALIGLAALMARRRGRARRG
ncbi:MAG TPA: MYXO-CTERM sorting domain-containing protein [Polyangia bacterium]